MKPTEYAYFLSICLLSGLLIGGCGREQVRDPAREAPPGFQAILLCTACNHRMPAKASWMSQMIAEKRAVESPQGGWRFPCPQCGQTTMIESTLGPDGNIVSESNASGSPIL